MILPLNSAWLVGPYASISKRKAPFGSPQRNGNRACLIPIMSSCVNAGMKRLPRLSSFLMKYRTKLFESCQEVSLIHRLLHSFLRMVRALKPELLDGWMKEVRESQVKELV